MITLFNFWDMRTWVMWNVFLQTFYKHSETISYVKKLAYFLINLQTSRINNTKIPRIKNARFSGYSLYMNRSI